MMEAMNEYNGMYYWSGRDSTSEKLVLAAGGASSRVVPQAAAVMKHFDVHLLSLITGVKTESKFRRT